MKIIDRTPFKGPDGQISAVDRVRAMAKYGSSWYSDIQAQDATAALLSRVLDRGYTLLVNAPLPGSEILLPLVLAGPTGVLLLNITNERGVFQAKGEDWGTLTNERFTPVKVNLITRTAKLAQALQKFLQTQGFTLTVEPVLLAMNPGMHIDSVRPAIRVVMSDAVERFALGLTQATHILSAETASVVADRILKPRPPQAATQEATEVAAPAAIAAVDAEPEVPAYIPQGQGEPQEMGRLDAESLGFAFNEDAGTASATSQSKAGQPSPAKKSAQQSPARKKKKGFSVGQWIALGTLFFIFVVIIAAIIVLAVMNA